MYILNLLLRLFIALCFIFLFLKIYNKKNTDKKMMNNLVLFSHILFLGLFSLNVLHLPYFLADVIFWSIIGFGVICCVNLVKNRSFMLALLVPTTIILILLIPPMLLFDTM